jgi:hypothetical protein
MSDNPFRSTAEMVADGTIQRPAHLGTSALADVSECSPAAAAVAKQVVADEKRRVPSGDRIGRLLH